MMFTEKANENTLSSNDDKRMQSIYSIKTYGATKDLVSENEEIKCNIVIKRYKND